MKTRQRSALTVSSEKKAGGADTIVSLLNSMDEDDVYDIFKYLTQNVSVWRSGPHLWDDPYKLLHHLLVVKAVEKGKEQAFFRLTTEGYHSFNPVEVDHYEPKRYLSFFSDMREEDTLYRMATRLWGGDETKRDFLQLLQELTVSPEAILREYVDEESASELRDYLEHLNFGDETAIRSHSIVKKISAEAETVVSVLDSMREG